jgi:hypothetical protein
MGRRCRPTWSSRGCGVRGGESGGAVLEAPALVVGAYDVAMKREPIRESGRHLGIADHRWAIRRRWDWS